MTPVRLHSGPGEAPQSIDALIQRRALRLPEQPLLLLELLALAGKPVSLRVLQAASEVGGDFPQALALLTASHLARSKGIRWYLFAEGRVETGVSQALMLPEASVVRSGDSAHVWRVAGGVVTKVEVRLGERDPRRGEYPVQDGLADGDQILRNPGSALVSGQKVEFARTATPAVRAPQVDTPKRVLFVGNSYIYYSGSVHFYTRRIALAADPAWPKPFQYKAATIAGSPLSHITTSST